MRLVPGTVSICCQACSNRAAPADSILKAQSPQAGPTPVLPAPASALPPPFRHKAISFWSFRKVSLGWSCGCGWMGDPWRSRGGQKLRQRPQVWSVPGPTESRSWGEASRELSLQWEPLEPGAYDAREKRGHAGREGRQVRKGHLIFFQLQVTVNILLQLTFSAVLISDVPQSGQTRI